jgi:TfdA family taurine catabolism dioxygenase TauD
MPYVVGNLSEHTGAEIRGIDLAQPVSKPGDLIMWDNRSLLHKADGDYDMNQRRYLYRIMLKGDAPV